MGREITRRDEEKFLQLKIADKNIFSESLDYDMIIDFILQGRIPLQISEEEGTQVLDNDLFNEIKKVVPFLLKIVDKPRSFIISSEEKVPIETAKRINHKAISKLSRDSNDWHARTIVSVKPKNIVAEVNEETIDLYENRFICSLIDRISQLVASRRQYYQDELNTIDNNNAVFSLDNYYYTTNSFPFFNKIAKNDKSYTESSYRKQVLDELRVTEEVEKKIRLLKRSDMYRLLHKKRRVRNPVQKTNILMFDYYYNQAYKLWVKLNKSHDEQKLEKEVEIKEGELDGNYFLYCLLLVFAALHDMGFGEETKKEIVYKDNRISIDGKLEFIKGIDKINLWVTDNEIHLSYNYDVGQNKCDEFVICPDYKDLEQLNRSQLSDHTEYKLNSLVVKEKFSSVSSKYSFVSINMNRYSDGNTLTDKVYRRFYGMGNNFSPEESKENLHKWGGYKTAIEIITPAKLRENFLRIEKIINYHLLKNISFNTDFEVCPLCGSMHIRKQSEGNFVCNNCHHNLSVTYCNACDPDKRKPIIWIRYQDDKFLQGEDVVRGDFVTNKAYVKMSTIEIIMGERAVTSFELAKDGNAWKLKTICPYCGRLLGETKNS